MNSINSLLLAIDNHDLLLWILIGVIVVYLAVMGIILSVFLRKKKDVKEEPGDVIIIRREEVVEETTQDIPNENTEVAAKGVKLKK